MVKSLKSGIISFASPSTLAGLVVDSAITLAEDIISNNDKKKSWTLQGDATDEEISITAIREGTVPGTHIVDYKSAQDKIEIKHEAYSREGFALGAVIAAEFIVGKKGLFTMKDILKF